MATEAIRSATQQLARYPDRWLNDRRLLRLSDAAHRLYVVALTWSVSNRTDGVLHDDDLVLLPRVDLARADELGKVGLWERHGDRWLVVDFVATQTTAAQLAGLEHKRAVDRERKGRQRARGTNSGATSDSTEPTAVPRDVTRDVNGGRNARHKGKARTGQESNATSNTTNTPSSNGHPSPSSLPAAARRLADRGYEQ